MLGLSQLPGKLKTKADQPTNPLSVKQPKAIGRPKGSKNKPREESQSASYQLLKTLLGLVGSNLRSFLPDLQCFHLVLDGFYGHEAYLLLALDNQFNLVSKLKTNAHLILPYEGPQQARGRHKINGKKVDLTQLDDRYYRTTLEDTASNVSTKVYQFTAKTPKIARHWLNVVVLVHTHQLTGRKSRTILFTNDLHLEALTVINFYSLRFQIEFDFRDAKQYFGLSDFKNYRQTQVTNAVNLAFTMTLVNKLLLEKYQRLFNVPTMGVVDLKAVFRIRKYVETLLNSDEFDADEFLKSPQFLHVARLEAIHL